MKTHLIQWQSESTIQLTNRIPARWNLAAASQKLLHLMAALVPAVMFPLVTVWAVNAGALEYAAATYWASGFILLALAFETNGLRQKLLLASGIAVMIFAWAGSRVAPEFVVLAATVPAAWFAGLVLQGLQSRNYWQSS